MSLPHSSAARPAPPVLDSATVKAEIDEEIQFHIDQVTAELVQSGWPMDAALAEARRRFGDASAIRKACMKERLKDKIMLQRINTALIAILIAAIAVFTFRSEAAASQERQKLESLRAVISQLGEQNQELVGLLRTAPASTRTPASMHSGARGPAETQPATQPATMLTMPNGSLPQSKVEEAFAAWIADRPLAARELATFGDAAVPLLAPVLSGEVVPTNRTPAGVVRFMAANILGDTGSPEAIDPLLAALDDEFMNVRRCAALALGKLGATRAIPALEDLAENDPYLYRKSADADPKALVRIDAANALELLRSATSPAEAAATGR